LVLTESAKIFGDIFRRYMFTVIITADPKGRRRNLTDRTRQSKAEMEVRFLPALSNWDTTNYAKFRSRSRDAVIRVYDDAGNVIETHEHKSDFKEW
jgi:hypothetical protein